ncbi:MAG: hypothetical protein V7655_04540 [Aequorivita antarctica]
MHSELLLKAYGKVKEKLLAETGIEPSVKACGDKLSLLITETFPYSEKSFRNLYNDAKEGKEIFIKQPKLVQAIAKYLEYKDYHDFENQNCLVKEEKRLAANGNANDAFTKGDVQDNGNPKPLIKRRNFQITISISFLLIICFLGYAFYTKQRWMEWKETHYVEVSFDSEKLREGSLKAYKAERITDFEKVTPICESKFFNDDGSVRVWYGKNRDGDLEYFTSYGLHPQTGKTLKPITRYMIGKYICLNNK